MEYALLTPFSCYCCWRRSFCGCKRASDAYPKNMGGKGFCSNLSSRNAEAKYFIAQVSIKNPPFEAEKVIEREVFAENREQAEKLLYKAYPKLEMPLNSFKLWEVQMPEKYRTCAAPYTG